MLIKVLFIGESWLGSCARGLREALARVPQLQLDEMNEDAYFPKGNSFTLRAINRLSRHLYRKELNRQVIEKVIHTQPDFVMTYKGHAIQLDLLRELKQRGIRTVNVYPDCSPHAHGAAHRQAIGAYDLVISTKAYHPALWADTYGYKNRCLFVPQGYDPLLHLVDIPPKDFEYDLIMVATYRQEYGRLLVDLSAALDDQRLRVAIGGYGWGAVRDQLPAHWVLTGPVQGHGYVSLLRSGKICIAPLTRNVVINGQSQPGDVDTTRSYELAAAYCFFIHRRTDFAQKLYGDIGVPMFDDAEELARHVRHFLSDEEERARIAKAAHERAVPAFSLDARAVEIVNILSREMQSATESVKT